MRKSYKLLAMTLSVVLAATAVTGCGNSKKDSKKTTSESTKTTSDKDLSVIEDAKKYVKLPDYSTIELKSSDIDKELKSNIDQALEAQATYKKIKTGKVAKDDTINIYYVGKLDGVAFDGGSCTKKDTPAGYDLTIGSGAFIPGFEDALIGKEIGKTCDIDVTFPDSYPQNTDLQGKKTVFTVTINYKNGDKIIPKFNNKFVKKYLSSYNSVEDYKQKTRESIINNLTISKVLEATEVKDYPKENLDAVKKQLKTSIENYLTQYNSTLDDYLKSINTTKEDYDKKLDETAKSDVKSQVVYNAIAQAENITVSQKEYDAAVKEYMTNFNCKDEKELDKSLKSYYGSNAKTIINSSILSEKVTDYLVKNVKES